MFDPLVSASPNHVSGELSGETILLSSSTNMYYGLDPVGSRIWTLIQEPKRISAICKQLASEFDVDPLTCERDIQTLVLKLADADLVILEA